MIGSDHWVSGQPSAPPTANGATPSDFALSAAARKSSHEAGCSIPSLSSCLGVFQISPLTLPLNMTALGLPSAPTAMSRTDSVYAPSSSHVLQRSLRSISRPCSENWRTMPGSATETSGGEPAANCCASCAWVWSNGTWLISTCTSGAFSLKPSITAWKASPSLPVQLETTVSFPDSSAGLAAEPSPSSSPPQPASAASVSASAAPVKRPIRSL